ncbi:guanylate kinase [Arcanobacterium sp. S3PF19]|uniref:guanylate kinase n=1 Tax=Arcanobacterium sp. S3PF19 TaxID=1219585 RepID=UPI0005103B79|nr:guanylate kinase [Arcanobacterium sp. S3PF19]KGF06342.1 guanylate kinase [Arcanobacterium sp. S3PF19]
MSDTHPNVYVVCGPTAVGKGTVLKEVFAHSDRLWYSVSATTRSPRPGEINGKDYYFVSRAEFDRMIADNRMLEWATVHKVHRYGTPREPVLQALAAGKIAVLELDLAGARQVRKTMPEAKQIFIAPPSWEALKQRLIGRGTEDAAEQERRLATARVELAAQDEFDEIVINDSVANATRKILHIMGINQ